MDELELKKIYNGMIGRDFIITFNDNVTLLNKTLLQLLGEMIYKIKSSDVKEFKVDEGVLKYTTEELVEGEEDTREWKSVDITEWGNIKGDINNQTDLIELLDKKAQAETVTTMQNLLSTMEKNLNDMLASYGTTELNVNNNSRQLAELQETVNEKVSSTNIKAIRLNNAVFQWTPDGSTWYQQPVVETVAWGNIVGDIESQDDLMQKFNEINNSITEINKSILLLTNFKTEIETKIKNLESNLENFSSTFEEYKSSVDTDLGTLKSNEELDKQKLDELSQDLTTHKEEENPHHITADVIGLQNVDNTSDEEKPVSEPQKTYITQQLENVKNEMGIDYLMPKGTGVDVIDIMSKTNFDFFVQTEDFSKLNRITLVAEDEFFNVEEVD